MNESDELPTTPRKKQRKVVQYSQVYLKKWEETFVWLRPGPTQHRAYCSLCKKDFSIAHGGQFDLKQHAQYKGHQSKEKSSSSTMKLSNYFVNVNKSECDKVAASEVALVYHAVKHNLSYSSLDCGNKLVANVFNDSETASKISCGRTKAEMLVKNVLAPRSVSDFVNILKDKDKTKHFFSVATDASNKGNRKMFPICIRYFEPSKGVENKLLNFVERADETSISICNMIVENLDYHSLSLDQVSAYSADNANVNFGIRHSVFQMLQLRNENIFKANCSNHIVHNAMKFALDKLDIDVENIVLKIYNHFSVSAKRRDELKSFFEFVHLQWSEILRHVPTRWLSLTPAMSRLLQNWMAIKSYFQSISDCPKALANVFLNEDPEKNILPEIYLQFLTNIGGMLEMVTKTLEKK